jgi:hypothetical protein
LKGAKQAAYKSPLLAAASHGHNRAAFRKLLTASTAPASLHAFGFAAAAGPDGVAQIACIS